MKILNLRTAIFSVIIVMLLFVAACRKKDKKDPEPAPKPDTEQTTMQDNNLAEMIANDIEAMGGQVSENGSLTTFRSSGNSASELLSMAPCASVSISGRIITVDFGSTGCLGLDGITRTGKLLYDFSVSSPTTSVFYRNPGFKVNISAQNYMVDGHQVNINSKTISNTTPLNIPQGENPGTNLTWSVAANITIIKPSNTGTISWSCNRAKELINTSDSSCYRGQGKAILWNKAIVKLNGSATGINAGGETFSSVATDLVRDFNCSPYPLRPHRHPFTSGKIVYTPGTRPARHIDYGNGSCDVNAQVTINGIVYNFTLP